jgi:tripartite-type tricarboxylate transporter receptor subunit TctC
MKPISRMRRSARASTLLLAVMAAPAFAAYPDKPVKLIVPYAPGATTDALARMVARGLEKSLKQPVIVDNRPGAGGTIGTAIAAKSPGDGYTLLLGAVGPVSIGKALYPRLNYDPDRELKALGIIGTAPFVVVAKAGRYSSLDEVRAAAKARPDRVAYGSAGNGTPQHIIGAMYAKATGVSLLHVAYKGSAPAITDLLGGQVDVMFDSPLPLLPHLKGGALVALAQTGSRRLPLLPNVPTIQETGLKNFSATPWYGILVPASTPEDIAALLAMHLKTVFTDQEFRARLLELGIEPQNLNAAQTKTLLSEQARMWTEAVRQSGAQEE